MISLTDAPAIASFRILCKERLSVVERYLRERERRLPVREGEEDCKGGCGGRSVPVRRAGCLRGEEDSVEEGKACLWAVKGLLVSCG